MSEPNKSIDNAKAEASLGGARADLREIRRHQATLAHFGRRRNGSVTATPDTADGLRESAESAVAIAVQRIGEAAFRLHHAQEAAIADLRRQLRQQTSDWTVMAESALVGALDIVRKAARRHEPEARTLAIARKLCETLGPLEARLAEVCARLV